MVLFAVFPFRRQARLGYSFECLKMPDDLSTIIEDLILDGQIHSLEDVLSDAERNIPDHPLLQSGWAILHVMKHYAALFDAEPTEMDALVADDMPREAS
ncbi:hypothetical protein QWE_11351 [Agrobacterium albertimagni AOL15]|uniref:Uncharacterized protein n=1 Tax=Agrobacterium albertimagni AOL15 TaxID=1156935 RepID=K2QEF6_9HYPH|nr:hypothetical protein [Agrobacterium albertimagni]EKF59391.1 hypothetical protein QWE_11351 [Agrobacterium albertimagni AOL15]